MIDTVLFDMDGVLIDAKEWHYESLNKALEFYNLKPITLDDHLTLFDGLPTKEKLKKYQEIYNINLTNEMIDNISNKKQVYTIEIANEKLVNDIKKIEMLKYLKNKNINIACCSNSIRKSVELFLKKAGLLQYFDFILSNEDVSKPKPNPEIYLTAIKKFNTDPKNVLIFEDNINGLKAAYATKSNVFEVKDPSNELTVDSISELLEKY